MKAFDTATDTTGHAHDIQEAGYGAVGIYLRFDRTSTAMVTGLHSVGVKVFSIYELGNPTSVSYFDELQGTHDGIAACNTANKLGQPKQTPIFVAFDYDANSTDLTSALVPYMKAFRHSCQRFGYLAGAYGSGLVLSYMQSSGLIHAGFLAQSKGWSNYDKYLPHAAIIQGATSSVLGFDVDLCEVKDLTVLW